MAIVSKTLDPGRPLTLEELRMLEELKNRETDLSDIPELTDEQLAQFVRVKEMRQADLPKASLPVKANPLRKVNPLPKVSSPMKANPLTKTGSRRMRIRKAKASRKLRRSGALPRCRSMPSRASGTRPW